MIFKLFTVNGRTAFCLLLPPSEYDRNKNPHDSTLFSSLSYLRQCLYNLWAWVKKFHVFIATTTTPRTPTPFIQKFVRLIDRRFKEGTLCVCEGTELLSVGHARWHLCPSEPRSLQRALGVPVGQWRLSTRPRRTLHRQSLGARGHAVPQGREHRLAVLHCNRVAGGDTGWRDCRRTWYVAVVSSRFHH